MSGTPRTDPQPSRVNSAIASSPWVLVAVGVVVMVVLLVIALGAYRGRGDGFDTPSDPPAPPLLLPELSASSATLVPTQPVRPGLSPRASVQPTTAVATPPRPAPVVTSGTVRPTPSQPPAPPAPPAPTGMTGRYQVIQWFEGGFIGEVLIRNETADRRGWTVRLSYGSGRLVTAWVEGDVQGATTVTAGGFTYRSGVDVAPGRTAILRFHMERADPRPKSCTVDGSPCVIA